MELEPRVKTLEYEVKILKNELQRTLLDIQEQILVHYYPSLSAEMEAPPESVVQALESAREQKQALGQPPEQSPAPIEVKKISLEEVETVRRPTSSPSEFEREPPPQSGKEMDRGTVVELSEWVNNTVGKIGRKHTMRLIEACAENESFTPEFKGFLLGFASLSNEGIPPEKIEMKETLEILLELHELLGPEVNLDLTTALALLKEEDFG